MYITRLKNWDGNQWEKYFKQYPKLKTVELKAKVKQILTLESKQAIEGYFPFLKEVGIINGIGPGYIGAFFRGVISFVFTGVRYEWHDIEFGIFGNIQDFNRSNYGLYKYSLETIALNFKIVFALDINILFKLVFILFYAFIAQIMLLVASFCYTMVQIFGKSAFSFE